MENISKIQCPNCGATSAFIEKSPGHYQCAYCHSQFEYVSIAPNASAEKYFYEQVLTLIHEYEAFETSRAKYFERMFSGLFQIHTYLDQIERIAQRKELLPSFQKLVEREFERIENEGIRKNTALKTVLEQDGKVVKLFYLKQYHKLLAHQLSQTYDAPNKLDKALAYLEDAQNIEAPTPSDFYLELMQCKFGILQRLGKKANAYDYLHKILNNPTLPRLEDNSKAKDIKEDLRVHFEPVLLSDDYQKYIQEHKSKS